MTIISFVTAYFVFIAVDYAAYAKCRFSIANDINKGRDEDAPYRATLKFKLPLLLIPCFALFIGRESNQYHDAALVFMLCFIAGIYILNYFYISARFKTKLDSPQ